jgi:hypothetical protein
MEKIKHIALAVGLIVPLLFIACKKSKTNDFVVDNDIKTPPPTGIKGTTVTFSRPDGAYTKAQAESDLGVPIIMTWQNTDIYSNQARVRIPANSLSKRYIVNIDVVDGTEYEVSFKIKFGSNFDWSRGGKVGFGLHVGNGYRL